jgi:hypothetical protein
MHKNENNDDDEEGGHKNEQHEKKRKCNIKGMIKKGKYIIFAHKIKEKSRNAYRSPQFTLHCFIHGSD